jgi:hypothetical protein
MEDIPSVCVVDPLLAPPEKTVPSFRICVNGAKIPRSSYRHAIRYTPGAAKVDSTQRTESRKAIEMVLGILCHEREPELEYTLSSFSKGVFSSKVDSSSFSQSGTSFVPSSFSSMSPREFLLDSADDKIFPYELDREGAGVWGGDTRAERIFKEFIVLYEPSRRSCDDLCRIR